MLCRWKRPQNPFAQSEVKRAEDALTRLEVKAPNAGVLVLERDWRGLNKSVGDTVWPGEKLGELPKVSDMQAALFVLEADAGDLVTPTTLK